MTPSEGKSQRQQTAAQLDFDSYYKSARVLREADEEIDTLTARVAELEGQLSLLSQRDKAIADAKRLREGIEKYIEVSRTKFVYQEEILRTALKEQL
jgi:predicted RNase H-like nuclease